MAKAGEPSSAPNSYWKRTTGSSVLRKRAPLARKLETPGGGALWMRLLRRIRGWSIYRPSSKQSRKMPFASHRRDFVKAWIAFRTEGTSAEHHAVLVWAPTKAAAELEAYKIFEAKTLDQRWKVIVIEAPEPWGRSDLPRR